MKAKLGADGLDVNPHQIAPDCWYYEEPGGIKIYYNGSLICIIPWRSIRASTERYTAERVRKQHQRDVKKYS